MKVLNINDKRCQYWSGGMQENCIDLTNLPHARILTNVAITPMAIKRSIPPPVDVWRLPPHTKKSQLLVTDYIVSGEATDETEFTHGLFFSKKQIWDITPKTTYYEAGCYSIAIVPIGTVIRTLMSDDNADEIWIREYTLTKDEWDIADLTAKWDSEKSKFVYV